MVGRSLASKMVRLLSAPLLAATQGLLEAHDTLVRGLRAFKSGQISAHDLDKTLGSLFASGNPADSVRKSSADFEANLRALQELNARSEAAFREAVGTDASALSDGTSAQPASGLDLRTFETLTDAVHETEPPAQINSTDSEDDASQPATGDEGGLTDTSKGITTRPLAQRDK